MTPELRIFRDSEALSRHAANLFIEQSNRGIRERNRFLVVLNGGATPELLYRLLATQYQEQVEWNKTHIFWGDERCVPSTNPESNFGQANGLLLTHVPIPSENIHRIKGELTPDSAAKEYLETILSHAEEGQVLPHFDLVFLGVGEDGHTASLFPGSPVTTNQLVVPVIADYQGRPAHRVTMTQRVFNQARMVVMMVAGDKKAYAMAEVLNGRYDPEKYPAQRIDPTDGQLIWLLDSAAASRLPRKIKGFNICEG